MRNHNKTNRLLRIIAVTILSFCSVAMSVFPVMADYPHDHPYTVHKTLSNTGDWDVGVAVGNTDIVIDPDKMGLKDATITYDGYWKKHERKTDYRYYEDRDHVGCYTLAYNGSSNNGNVSAGTHNINKTVKFVFPKAARGIASGQWYDIHMDVEVKKIKLAHSVGHGVPLFSGCNTTLSFVTYTYKKDGHWNSQHHGYHVGGSFMVDVRLYKAGTSTQIGYKTKSDGTKTPYKMAWGFSDVDIHDAFNSSTNHQQDFYDSSGRHDWAEHVSMYNLDARGDSNKDNRFFSPIYLSTGSELKVIERPYDREDNKNHEDIDIYHEFEKTNNNYNKSDKTVAFLVRANPNHFKFKWQGSHCATGLFGVAGTMYEGYSKVYVNNVNKTNNKTVTISDNNATVKFWHNIYRLPIGPTTDTEEYYIYANSNAPDGEGSSSSTISYSAAQKSNKTYTQSKSIALSPGQNKISRQELHFQLSNVNTSLGPHAQVSSSDNTPLSCTLTNPTQPGSVCVKLHRPTAHFTGSVTPTIISGAGDSPNVTSAGTEIKDNDGNFSVGFTDTIKRNTTSSSPADNAGGTATTSWNVVQKLGGTSGSNISGTSDSNTVTLSPGGSSNVKQSNTYKYTGRLKYGESRTICSVLSFDKTIDATNGNTPNTASGCITVWRAPKKCDLNATGETYEYGIKNGKNLGRIGVVNHTYPNSTADYNYTSNNLSSFTTKSTGVRVNEVNVWARPGDSIRFKQETCAGGAYAVNNNSSISASSYPTTYTSKGYRDDAVNRTTGAINAKSRYLFGQALSDSETVGGVLNYKNSKGWSPTGETAEWSKESPSTASITTSASNPYKKDDYRNNSYSCYTFKTGRDFKSNHYQITGKDTSLTTTDGCHAYSRTYDTSNTTTTAKESDVGHVITQQLSWNGLTVANGSATKGDTYIAQANVKVPYNYNIQPAIDAATTNHVAYLGSNLTFNVYTYVSPRVNTSFGDSESENYYATITKPTTIEVKYYFKTATNDAAGLQTHRETIRLNKSGNINGALDGNSPISSNGGARYATTNIYIDDSSYDVGDQVCASIKVSPADSHNNYMAASVSGAGSGNAALSESGSSSSSTEKTTCYSIAKKPTTSFESSNAYSGGNKGFVTSKFTKHFSASGTDYVFGSWSEYGLFGKVDTSGTHGTASGATFGYQTQNNGISKINKARDNTGSIATTSNTSNICAYSTQTFVNATCNAAIPSVGSNNISAEGVKQFRNRIYDRFASSLSSNQSNPVAGSGTYTFNGGNPQSNTYVKIGGVSYVYLHNWINERFDSNGINHTFIKSDAYLGSATTAPYELWAPHNFGNGQSYTNQATGQTYTDRNYTRLIEVRNQDHNATLIIDGDIKVGNPDTRDNDPQLHNAGEVVQVVIIADKVEITSRVNQIDAIIIANEINTCAYSLTKINKTTGVESTNLTNLINGTKTKIGGSNSISSDDCSKQLIFRAPVITKKITLNRTFGSGKGSNAAQRAEVFDLNPYTYLWSFGQMNRYSQAVTVFSRELPPRY